MATVFAPGVAQLRLVGTVGPNPFACVLHWYTGSSQSWPLSTLTTLGDTAKTAWTSHLVPNYTAQVNLDYVEAVDLSDAVERVHKTTGPAIPGTLAGSIGNLAGCVLVSHEIGARYRGGHPRTYLPPGPSTQANDGDNWNSTYATSMQTAFVSFKNDIQAAVASAGLTSNSMCAPRYTYTYTPDSVKHKFIKTRTGFVGPFPITNSTVSPPMRTQRRRLGK